LGQQPAGALDAPQAVGKDALPGQSPGQRAALVVSGRREPRDGQPAGPLAVAVTPALLVIVTQRIHGVVQLRRKPAFGGVTPGRADVLAILGELLQGRPLPGTL
jgi:hypothetical protein